MNLDIDKDGMVRDARIKVKRFSHIEHGNLGKIDAIIVHQTDSSSAEGAFNSYKSDAKATGAHFLIDKDGTIYQTASLNQKCWHVAPIKSRCREIHSCSPKEQAFQKDLQKKFPQYGRFVRELAKHEWTKDYPDRYPGNDDAIGIEIVGRALKRNPKDTAYEPLTPDEQKSLKWLIQALIDTLHLQRTDVYRHPEVGYKTAGEAADAQW